MEVLASSRVVRFGTFEVDLTAGELRKQGLKVRLQERPFQVLAVLLEHPGEVVTREELYRRLWPADTFVDFDVGLNTAIKKLRDALGDAADSPRFVETLPRKGYRFIAPIKNSAGEPGPVMVVCEAQPRREELSAIAAGGSGGATPSISSGRRRMWMAWLGLACAAGIGALVFARHRGSSPDPLVGNTAVRIQSVAVLPFDNLTGELSQDYFVDGITDALITELAQIRALRVISRTSVAQYKASKKLLPQIARELRVDAVVEGTVRRAGDQVWITSQLVEAAADRHLWAKRYELKLREVPVLQNQVAQDIVAELRLELTAGEWARLVSPRPPGSVEAYDAYLQARYYWNKRTEDGLKRSVDLFRQAIRADPNYALAYAGLADSYNLLGRSAAAAMPAREAAAQGRAAATRALELDAGLGAAHAALGYTKYAFEWDWAGAEAEFQRAIDLSPGYATAFHWYSLYLSSMGRNALALSMIQRAQQLDPVSPNIRRMTGMQLAILGRYDEAIQESRKAIELDPSHFNTHLSLGNIYLRMGSVPEAIAEFDKAVEVSDRGLDPLAHLAYAYALAGRRAESELLLAEVERRDAAHVYSSYCAAVCTALGRRNDAFIRLEKAFETHSGALVDVRVQPAFIPLHSDPRFENLLRRMNFPQVVAVR
jgi:TolB-like protein/DNA-binding winged helix-turn-helix (wHTH) protein/Tfp pilus assembly protein PilF